MVMEKNEARQCCLIFYILIILYFDHAVNSYIYWLNGVIDHIRVFIVSILMVPPQVVL